MNRRFVAYMLDGLLYSVLALSGVSAIGFGISEQADAIARVVIIAVIGLAYFGVSWTQAGGSPFQRLLGMRTLSAADGTLMTPSQAVRRWAFLYGPGQLASALTVMTGASAVNLLPIVYAYYLYRTASRDPQRRGLHDHQSGTIVVRSAN